MSSSYYYNGYYADTSNLPYPDQAIHDVHPWDEDHLCNHLPLSSLEEHVSNALYYGSVLNDHGDDASYGDLQDSLSKLLHPNAHQQVMNDLEDHYNSSSQYGNDIPSSSDDLLDAQNYVKNTKRVTNDADYYNRTYNQPPTDLFNAEHRLQDQEDYADPGDSSYQDDDPYNYYSDAQYDPSYEAPPSYSHSQSLYGANSYGAGSYGYAY
jgi:hypothetical protein